MSSLVSAGSTLAQSVTGVIIVLFLSYYFPHFNGTIKAWGVRLALASKRGARQMHYRQDYRVGGG